MRERDGVTTGVDEEMRGKPRRGEPFGSEERDSRQLSSRKLRRESVVVIVIFWGKGKVERERGKSIVWYK